MQDLGFCSEVNLDRFYKTLLKTLNSVKYKTQSDKWSRYKNKKQVLQSNIKWLQFMSQENSSMFTSFLTTVCVSWDKSEIAS